MGLEHVNSDGPALTSAQTATFRSRQRVCAILQPGDREEVQQCVRIANAHKIPIYPVSSGRNWGFGSSVPSLDGSVILHLGRLNRITDFDENLACVTIEPGVTQLQLFDYLRQRESKLWMDATGSSMDCSLIGNVMERGVGFTPYADHFGHVCGLEVILATGDCVHTGFGRFVNAKATNVCRWGVGPYLDGIFSQSNLGIVTQMTMWLMPGPEHFQACYFNIEGDGELEQLIRALHLLKRNGTIRGAIHLYNDYSLLTSIQQYPWQEAGERVPIPSDLMQSLRKTWDLGAWHGSMGLYGNRREIAQVRRLVKRAFDGKVRKLHFLDDQTIRLSRLVEKPYRFLTGLDLAEIIRLTLPGYGLLKGIPTEKPICSTYWRKKGPIPPKMNPDRDRCGLIWCSPAAPLDATHARTIIDTARAVLMAYDFEPIIGLNVITERCFYCMIAISYDRDAVGEDERAMNCHDELLQKLTKEGYFPYRLGIQSMNSLPPAADDYKKLLDALKGALDPNNILAPGRYE